MIKKEKVLERLCEISSEVMDAMYNCSKPADCFCGDNPGHPNHFQFSEEVLSFIEDAVREKIGRESQEESERGRYTDPITGAPPEDPMDEDSEWSHYQHEMD